MRLRTVRMSPVGRVAINKPALILRQLEPNLMKSPPEVSEDCYVTLLSQLSITQVSLIDLRSLLCAYQTMFYLILGPVFTSSRVAAMIASDVTASRYSPLFMQTE